MQYDGSSTGSHGFWRSLWDVTNPFSIWKGGETSDHIMALVMGFFYLFIIFMIVVAVIATKKWISDRAHWYKHRRRCHDCTNYTLDVSQGVYPECAQGDACCSSCATKHKADNEDKRICPVDERVMDKIVDDGLVYDRCSTCGHYLLASDELEALRQRSYDKGYAAGRSSGAASGVATGTAIN